MFLFDTGLRPPLELIQLKVSDLLEDCKKLHIRIYKKSSFERTINLTFSRELLKQYLAVKKKKNNDYIFDINPDVINKVIKKKG